MELRLVGSFKLLLCIAAPDGIANVRISISICRHFASRESVNCNIEHLERLPTEISVLSNPKPSNSSIDLPPCQICLDQELQLDRRVLACEGFWLDHLLWPLGLPELFTHLVKTALGAF